MRIVSRPLVLLFNCITICLAVVMLLPGVWIIAASLTPSRFLNQGLLLKSVSLENYFVALESANFLLLYRNSFVYALGLLAAQIPVTLLAAYGMARAPVRAAKLLFYVVLFQFFLPPVALIVPNFILISRFGLTDTLVGIALPYVASATGTLLLRQGIRQIPTELEEAALIDGAGRLQILLRVVAPLVGPYIGAFCLVSFVYHWNEFIWPLVVLSSPEKRVLSVGFASFTRASESGAEWGLIAAGAVLVAAPLVVAFLLAQRFFIESFARTGLKG